MFKLNETIITKLFMAGLTEEQERKVLLVFLMLLDLEMIKNEYVEEIAQYLHNEGL